MYPAWSLRRGKREEGRGREIERGREREEGGGADKQTVTWRHRSID